MRTTSKIVFSIAVAGIALMLLALAAAYSKSCKNTGRVLSLGEFFEGVAVRTSNCGGNSAALSVCREIWAFGFLSSSTNSASANFSNLTDEDSQQAHSRISSHWIPNARYLLLTGDFDCSSSNRLIVVICGVAYGNVPQPNFWNQHRETPRHAVAYANGDIGLITPEEFSKLDKTKYAEASLVLPRLTPNTNQLATPFE